VQQSYEAARPKVLGSASAGRPDGTAKRHKALEPSFIATPKQLEFLEAILSGKYNYLAIGGGIRGTKTFAVLAALFLLCRMFPGSRWAIVRKDLPTLRRNLLPSFYKIRQSSPYFISDFHQQTWTAKCKNGSEILLFPEGFERDVDLDRWKGLEVNGFVLEEANELVEKSFAKAIERAGSWFIPATMWNPEPIQPPPLILCTFNPCQNWPKKVFFDPWDKGLIKPPYYYLPSTVADNPYATDEYQESLKNLPPAEYKRFVLGDWSAANDPDQLILAEWVWNAQQSVSHILGQRKLGVDVARFGDDLTTLALINGNGLQELLTYSGLSLDRTAATVAGIVEHYDTRTDPRNVHVDSVGLGSGVVDILRGIRHLPVTEIISGAREVYRPDSYFKFKNIRSQMWWEFREKLRLGLFCLPLEGMEELVGDLTAPKYKMSADKMIQIESKEEIKKRIGRSTDRADALVMAAFDMPLVLPSSKMAPSISNVTIR